MPNFYTFTSEGNMTLTLACSIVGCNKQDLYVLNNTIKCEKDPELTVSQYLQMLDLKGEKIPKGVVFRVPVGLTGGVNTKYSIKNYITTLKTTDNNTDTKYNVHDLMRSKANSGQKSSGSKYAHSQVSRYAANYTPFQDFDCYVFTYLNGYRNNSPTMYLPVYPNEFSDTNNANFSAVSLLGRSVDYQIYQGSSRSVSFTLNLHEELCNSPEDMHDLVAYIESACYPDYTSGVVQAPEIVFKIGRHFKIRGILTSCTANWKAPIIDGRLVNCDLSVSITETTGPYSSGGVASRGGFRG